MEEPVFVPHHPWRPDAPPEVAAKEFYQALAQRRSIRHFSDAPVSLGTMQWIVRSAASAPSGANKQPWRFVCVQDSALKKQIRLAAEEEERRFYQERATVAWKADLHPLGTDEVKEYLEIAPWLVVIFKLTKDDDGGGVYYGEESVGIATGMLLAAAQMAGLATLTHTPSPMDFLASVLERPANERAWMLIPMGWPAKGCEVPQHGIDKKPLEQVMVVK